MEEPDCNPPILSAVWLTAAASADRRRPQGSGRQRTLYTM